jgi:hypothetical protein
LTAALLLSVADAQAGAAEAVSSSAPMDFVAYWSASRLLMAGRDPYAPAGLLELQRQVGLPGGEPLIMWNPPWTFALALPFALFDFSWAQLLWLGFSIFAVLFSATMLWKIYGGSPGYSRLPWLLALTFFPTILVLLFGQISPIVLLGLTCFVLLLRRRQCVAAGAVLAIAAVKPHFIYLFWIALLLWIWQRAQWRVLGGAALAGLAAAALPLFFDPAVYSHFFELYRTAPYRLPLDMPAPTLRNVLTMFLSVDSVLVEHLPTAAGVLWIFAYWRRHEEQWSWEDKLPLILLVSVVTTAYTWTFDQVIFLPAIMQAAAWTRGRTLNRQGLAAVVVYCLADVLYLVLKFRLANDLYYFWFAPTLLIVYLLLKHGGTSAAGSPGPASAARRS